MPVIYAVNQDMFKLQADVIVGTMNCVGIAGKGVALQCKMKFGQSFMAPYLNLCKKNILRPGTCQFQKGETQDFIYFATKDHWRDPSKIEWIESGLQNLRKQIEMRDLESVVMSYPGCGNGGLSRDLVRPLLDKYLSDLTCTVTICS